MKLNCNLFRFWFTKSEKVLNTDTLNDNDTQDNTIEETVNESSCVAVVQNRKKHEFISYQPFTENECPCCFEEYSELNGRIMPWECYHTICFKCYTDYTDNIITHNKGFLRKKKKNRCVMCRSVVELVEYNVNSYLLHGTGNRSIYIPQSFRNNSNPTATNIIRPRRDMLQAKFNYISGIV